MLFRNFMFLLLLFRMFCAQNWPSILQRIPIIVIQVFVTVLFFQMMANIENILYHNNYNSNILFGYN